MNQKKKIGRRKKNLVLGWKNQGHGGRTSAKKAYSRQMWGPPLPHKRREIKWKHGKDGARPLKRQLTARGKG